MMQFRNPDYVKYAEACGAVGYHVDRLEDFDRVFTEALALDRPVLIDVAVDGDVYAPYRMAHI
jgi:acetolactate synthase I/II/III large subunit